MVYFKKAEIDTSDGFIYVYSGIHQLELEKLLDAVMTQNEYQHLGQGVYEKGNRTMRLLFGGFCKYYKFKLSIDSSDLENIKVRVLSYSSGLSGGLLGLNKVKRETNFLRELFKTI